MHFNNTALTVYFVVYLIKDTLTIFVKDIYNQYFLADNILLTSFQNRILLHNPSWSPYPIRGNVHRSLLNNFAIRLVRYTHAGARARRFKSMRPCDDLLSHSYCLLCGVYTVYVIFQRLLFLE